ncbi:MAG: PKD domain-containing protein [Chitinophagales bacterium]|nr:PKD domain-containing protein [Bacteroidota bacterium]MBP7398587.1 PKD domain-containing protein [Chitinophagales bacterium]MBK8487393.1 PKD domain-containing protein [Bacteroidota bacterium]MBK8682865.1 PKD domain-containing protein [Bacteroidota bacterium]MBP8752899.1 PKD domain-containing protein [Chitinophagales bacterium]
MKKIILFTTLLFAANFLFAQTVVFSDDFESGADLWDVDGYWDVTDEYAFEGEYSFNESPYDATYVPGVVQTATMAESIALVGGLDASVSFKALIDLEEGFDFTYLDASPDGGDTWINIATFNGEDMLDTWQEFEFPLGAFFGSLDFKLRFRFVPDMLVEYNGMFIDDIEIFISNVDVSPPLILHTPSVLYEGTLEATSIAATLMDATGISETSLFYKTDSSPFTEVEGTALSLTDFIYVIPAQAPGVWVDYYIVATDSFFLATNTAVSDTFSYIAGNYIGYDDAVIDYVQEVGDEAFSGYLAAAVQISLPAPTDLVAVVIQNYTDNMRPNDSITVHIWADDDGLPGVDLITPFKVKPEAKLSEPNRGTRVDLRDYVDELSGIYGDIFIGFSCDSAAWVSQTTPAEANRTYTKTTWGGWNAIFDDYHFRAITSEFEGAPSAFFSYDLVGEPMVAFTDLSTNSPTSWSWTLGDGGTSTDANPLHTYLANGTYYVCLTASNVVGSGTYCDFVTVDNYAVPVAAFSYAGDPMVAFTDLSLNDPGSWAWEFGDGATSDLANPTHTYATNGTYNVCLTATNFMGSNEDCQSVVIGGNIVAPVADFTFAIIGETVTFTDLSTNTPTFWGWNFNDGSSSAEQNPTHIYATPGEYNVCLTSGNIAGTNEACKMISILNSVNTITLENIALYPNPVNTNLQIDFKDLNGQKSLYVYNASGQLTQSFSTTDDTFSLNVEALPAGNYQLKIINDKNIGMFDFLIIR